MSDEEIISLFFARDEQALVYTEAKYGPYCFAQTLFCPSRKMRKKPSAILT